MLEIIPSETSQSMLHQYLLGCIAPRPICFAGTIDKNGNSNLSPFSFFNIFSSNPPIVIFSPARSGRDGTLKHTFENVLEVPECTINIVNFNLVQQMNLASAPFAKGVSEYEKAGFTKIKSDLIKPHRIKEAPAQLECKVIETKMLGTGGGAGNLIFAEVLKIHIDEQVLDANQKIDPNKMDLVGRLNGSWYTRAKTDLFELAQPMTVRIGYDNLPTWIKENKELTAEELTKLAMCETMPTDEDKSNAQKYLEAENVTFAIKKLIASDHYSTALALAFLV